MQLTFLPVRLDFNSITRAVHVVALYEGRNIDVPLSCAAIEDMAGAQHLDMDAALTTVVRNKTLIARAAERAIAQFGGDCRAAVLELSHLFAIGRAPAAAS